MSSNSKIEKYEIKYQLLYVRQSIRQELTLAEVKDPQMKINYAIERQFEPHLRMTYFYVLKKQELGQGIEDFIPKNWRVIHFLPTAAYFEQEA